MSDTSDNVTLVRSEVPLDRMTDVELILEWEKFGRDPMSDLHTKLNSQIKLTKEESAALGHNMRVDNELKRRRARSFSFERAWKRHLISIALEFMDVPQMRQELTPVNLRWLVRNLGIRNSQNRHFKDTIKLIKFLLVEEARLASCPSADQR